MKKLFGASVLASALIMAACGSSSSNVVDTTPVSGITPTSVPTSSVQDAGADIYSLIGGGTIDLTRGPNARPMALWFWAPG